MPPVRPVSKKTAHRNRRYTLLRVVFLETHPACQIKWDRGCTGWATEVDHRVNRSVRPDLVLDTSLWQASCSHCHHMKTTHPTEAHRRGLALKSWEVA